MKDKEYELKWQYVMHTEKMQSNFIQWYITVSAAVFLFIYSEKISSVTPLVNDRWLALLVLALYSVLTCLRLLIQKRNYDTYTKRLRVLEGNSTDDYQIRTKVFTSFKLQYYIICLVGGLVFFALGMEITISFITSLIIGFSYSLLAVALSFTGLIGK